MRKDYKDRVPGTLSRSRRRGRSAWLWAIPAILVGVAAIAVLSFTGREETAADSTTSVSASEVAAQAEKTVAEKKADAPAEVATKPSANDKKPAAGKPGKKKTAPAEKVPEVNLPEPRFTFYKILPEKEVIVSESEIRNLARSEKAGKAEASGSYLIQAGSFAKQQDAEKMKALLAEAKVKAKMEKVLIENATWYRVKVGPYKSLTEAERMRAYLRKQKIDSVLQQTRP